MKLRKYDTPVMRKLGSVKELTKGARGRLPEGGGAGSIANLPPN
jgi:hypothetical protein